MDFNDVNTKLQSGWPIFSIMRFRHVTNISVPIPQNLNKLQVFPFNPIIIKTLRIPLQNLYQ